jgi:hypothetical protein
MWPVAGREIMYSPGNSRIAAVGDGDIARRLNRARCRETRGTIASETLPVVSKESSWKSRHGQIRRRGS